MEDIRTEIAAALREPVEKIILSNRVGDYPYKKVEVRPVVVKKTAGFQLSCYTQTQVFQTNVEHADLLDELLRHFPQGLCQMNIFGEKEEAAFKVTKKGKLLSNRKRREKPISLGEREDGKAHNRKKNYILKEGTVVPALVDMGVFTKEGKVIASMYDKFKQINRFVELVDDILRQDEQEEINIVDFGCGKSYLTFILYYYLVELKGKRANIVGLDLKNDVIEKCNRAAEKYGYQGLRFERGDIRGYHTDMRVDMVVSLHACDTATDYALANAVNWNARYILSVPCCQHELNGQIENEELATLFRHGIIKERMAALATDALRADMLTYRGYKTQVLEFVDLAHSPKNLLIRAVKSAIPKQTREQVLTDIENLKNCFSADPTIYRLLFGEKHSKI